MKLGRERLIIQAQYHTLLQKQSDASDGIKKLQAKCPHPEVLVIDGDRIKCPDCGFETEGWYCDRSPTLECVYTDPETGHYDEDACIHCRHPLERK